MAPPSGYSPAPAEPPWPPDLCQISRDSSPSIDALKTPSLMLHPEVSPPILSVSVAPPLQGEPIHSTPPSLHGELIHSTPPSLQGEPIHVTPPSSRVEPLVSPPSLPNPLNPHGPSHSPSPASWVSKLKSSVHNLKKMASPTFADDGTPVVKAPDSVVLKSSEIWKGHLVAQFHGTAPSPAKIFADLNPIWGKQGRIRVRYHSKNVCLIFIPCELSRKWVLDVGLWHSGKCAFSVSEWSPKINLAPMKLEYAPVWIIFRGIPQELWSLECFSTIATGVGIPIQSEFPKLTPYSNGIVKLRVTIKLEKKRAPYVKVVDKLGNSVLVSTEYLKVPHKCGLCSDYGHSEQRCPDRNIPKKVTVIEQQISSDHLATPPDPVASNPSVGSARKSPSAAAASNVGSSVHRENGRSSPQPPSPSKKNSGALLKRTSSLPTPMRGSVSSRLAGENLEWVPVRHRSPPLQEPASPPARQGSTQSVSCKPVTSSQFDSEEELIKVAQSILRKRIAAAEAQLPPFSTAKDKKNIRRQQRHAFLQLCDDLVDQPPTIKSTPSSNVVPRELPSKGECPTFLEA